MEERNNCVNKKDDLYQILDRTTTWIENCDTKASIVIGGIGIISSIILSSDYIKKIISILKYMFDNISFWTGGFLLITIAAVIFGITGFYNLFRVLVPSVNASLYKEKGLTEDSLMFFYSISMNKTYEDFKSKLEKCSESNLNNDIASQIYICSKICAQKFEHYKRGLNLIVVAFATFGIMMVIGSIII